MKLETKRELLRYELLNQRFIYNMEVYHLFNFNKMNNIINKISEASFSYQINIKENEITSTQFLKYLNELVRYMKLYFYNISCFNAILDEIIKSCNEEIIVLFDYKCDDPYNCYKINKDDNIKDKVFKIIISNFVKNAKYIPLIKEILKENGLKIKNIQDYNLKESEKILNILSDIAFCQRGKGEVIELFINIEYNLDIYIAHKKKSKKYTIEDYKKKYIESYLVSYERMIKSYNIRKKYLKHFI